MSPRNLVVLGSWFMLREVEAANARVKDVSVVVRDGCPRVVWSLPASKTDQRAAGVSRAHGCACTGTPKPSCPAHAAWAHASSLRTRFGEISPDSPFFPDVHGRICTKESIAATLVEAASFLDVPKEDATGKITGHTMRVTGAQGLAAAGLDLWAIQLLGRWGSMAVRSYVREAHLEQAEGWARKVAQQKDITEVTKALAEQIGEKVGGSEVWKALEDKAKAKLKEVAESTEVKVPVEKEMAEALAVEALPIAAQSSKLDVVVSSAGIAHCVAFGPPEADLALSVTSCGWRFGGAVGAKLTPKTDMPALYKKLCARCFPDEREASKAVFAAEAKDV